MFWQHRLQIVYENATESGIAISDVAMEPVRNWMQTFWQNFLTVALCGTILTMSIITPWIERYCCQVTVTSSVDSHWITSLKFNDQTLSQGLDKDQMVTQCQIHILGYFSMFGTICMFVVVAILSILNNSSWEDGLKWKFYRLMILYS